MPMNPVVAILNATKSRLHIFETKGFFSVSNDTGDK